jgi:hypothetical protein
MGYTAWFRAVGGITKPVKRFLSYSLAVNFVLLVVWGYSVYGYEGAVQLNLWTIDTLKINFNSQRILTAWYQYECVGRAKKDVQAILTGIRQAQDREIKPSYE